MLEALLCIVCLNLTPDGRPYVEADGAFRSIHSPRSSDIEYGFAAGLTRVSGTGPTVAGQFNAHSKSGVHSQAWGVASEAVAQKGSKSILVGLESLVGNYEPENYSAKIGVNVVYKSVQGYTNSNSIGLWFTADPNTGFRDGINFYRHSVTDTILNLEDIPLDKLKNMNLIKLPNCKALRWTGEELKVVNIC